MSAELYNKIVLYTTPFYDMEETPEVPSYLAHIKEIDEDPDDKVLHASRGNMPKKDAVPLYTAAEAVEKKKAATECAICHKVFEKFREKHGDHSHLTGKGRGVLCGNCNHALGMLKDNPELCEAAAAYLRERL